ncbi:MAG: TrkH family potassium uptake protein [Clostridia bacterium]|jgi:trk system potassium uptake protein TrkH|nr:TrkH family potassium uptake protein [Clostridia bacterium]
MNYRNIIAIMGVMLIIVGISMIFPAVWSLYYGEDDWSAFLLSSAITVSAGLLAHKATGLRGEVQHKEAIAVLTLSWIAASAFGSLPYLLTGTFVSFADAVFETISGFTTTGASVIPDVEIISHGVLFWRSLTLWLGGMGIIVLFVAVLSSLGVNTLQMFRAESPGAGAEKIKPRAGTTAKILWFTYVGLTVVEILILWALGMPLFDAFCHAFGVIGTGGFSTKNSGIAYFDNPLLHWAMILFMFLSGANFALHYQAFRGKDLRVFWKNGEFRLYAHLMLLFTVILTGVVLASSDYSFEAALRQAAFHVTAIMTTTGYAISDYDLWPYFGRSLLVLLMFIGSCSGSTGGSIKVGRLLILLKQFRLELQRAIHPRAIVNAKINGRSISSEMMINVQQFFFIYLSITAVSTVIISSWGIDLVSAFTAAAAIMSNVGTGLGLVGPMHTYDFLPAAGKYYLSFLMIVGRLELYAVLVLFLPSFWKK